MKRWIRSALCAVLALSLACGAPGAYALEQDAPEQNAQAVPGTYVEAASRDGLTLWADPASGNFILTDDVTGLSWGSAPLEAQSDETLKGAQKNQLLSFVTATVLNPEIGKETAFSSAIPAGQGELGYEAVDGGYRIEVEAEGVTFCVEVTLESDSCVRVSMPMDSLAETDTAWLKSVSFAPSLLAGSSSQEGFLLVPDGSGAIIEFNNGKKGSYSEPVYGTDKAFLRTALAAEKQDAALPVYGIENSGAGMIAVIDGGAAAASIRAASAGNGSTYNQASATFTLREQDAQYLTDDVSQTIYEEERTVTDDLTVLFYPVREVSGGYMGMARALRTYLTGRLGMTESAGAATPGVLTVYGGVAQRQKVLGVPLWKSASALTTYGEAGEMLRAFGGSGALTLELQMWDDDGILGRAASEASASSALGGAEQLGQLVQTCEELGSPLLAGVAAAQFSRGGNGVSVKADAVRTLTQEPAAQYPYWRSSSSAKLDQASYLREPQQLPDALSQYAQSAAALGFSGVSVTDLGSISYSNYREGALTSADQSAAFAAEAVSAAAQQGTAAVHGGFLFAAAGADLVLDVPSGSSRFACADREIPFYQIALSGLTVYGGKAVNLQADPDDALLWALETGGVLHWAFAGQTLADLSGTPLEDLTGLSWEMGGETAVAQASEYLPLAAKVAGQQITDHTSPAEGVSVTQFANGVRVAVNYTDADAVADGALVPAHGYYFWE